MPRRRRSPFAVVLLGLAVAVCCLILGAGAALSGIESLGPPSPGLSAIERTTLGLYLLAQRGALLAPAGSSAQTLSLDVEPGMDAASITDELARLGVLDRPDLMKRYLQYLGLDTRLEAGRFEVSGAMSITELAETLQRAGDSRYAVTIPEGWRLEEIAEQLGQAGLSFVAEDFIAAALRPPPAWADAPETAGSLEGFAFPDTYQLSPDIAAGEVIEMMLANLEARLSDDFIAGFSAQGLTAFEAFTLASIVEREAALPAERPLIASVFLNRLRLGIPLQADPTVQYAVGRQPDSWWKAPLTAEDLLIDSRYNTYIYSGLPPGPIANPGLASLESVAFPAETGYLFFRAACDGSGRHVFADTFEEHVANGCP